MAISNFDVATQMIGATSSANGAGGYVPQPLIDDKDKFLKGDGTWNSAPGARVLTITGTITNSSGSYSGVINNEQITSNMKPLRVEMGNASVVRGAYTITCYNGYLTFVCSNVVGTTSVSIDVIKQMEDPIVLTSAEFDTLANRIINSVTWKYVGSVTGNEDTITLPTTYNELYVGIKYSQRSYVWIIPHDYISQMLLDTDTHSFYSGYCTQIATNNNYHGTVTVSITSTTIAIGSVRLNGSHYESTSTLYVFYR